MLLILTQSAYANNDFQHYYYTYKNVNESIFSIESACIQAMLICAAWSAKFTEYNFVEFDHDDCRIFIAYNCDCNFSIRLYEDTRECYVEFDASDDSFDYDKFITNIDSFFSKL